MERGRLARTRTSLLAKCARDAGDQPRLHLAPQNGHNATLGGLHELSLGQGREELGSGDCSMPLAPRESSSKSTVRAVIVVMAIEEYKRFLDGETSDQSTQRQEQREVMSRGRPKKAHEYDLHRQEFVEVWRGM